MCYLPSEMDTVLPLMSWFTRLIKSKKRGHREVCCLLFHGLLNLLKKRKEKIIIKRIHSKHKTTMTYCTVWYV